jgi:hypothetical protein
MRYIIIIIIIVIADATVGVCGFDRRTLVVNRRGTGRSTALLRKQCDAGILVQRRRRRRQQQQQQWQWLLLLFLLLQIAAVPIGPSGKKKKITKYTMTVVISVQSSARRGGH